MLEELQSLNAARKKQILIIATIIIMIIIIGVWFSFFNSMVMGSAQSAADQVSVDTPVASVPAAHGPSLWQNIENGFGSVTDIFKKTSQYNIQPQSN